MRGEGKQLGSIINTLPKAKSETTPFNNGTNPGFNPPPSLCPGRE